MAGNIRGLNDLKDAEEEEKRQAYYAGGQGQNGGGSGQQILDPREFMRRARDELGARSIDEYRAEQRQAQEAAGGGGFETLGAGRALNAPNSASGEAAGAADAAEGPGGASEGAEAAPAPQTHTITFYRDGFTVNDGPLRRTDDPENAQFLADINRGTVPRELEDASGGADLDVHCIDKSTEAYTPPPVTMRPFTGEGRTMRDGGDADAAPQTAAVTPAEVEVEASAPTTSVQVRLPDGSRRVVKLNHTHTVGQLRAHVATFTPAGAAFELSTQFPRAKLTEDGKTVSDAGLLNNTVAVTLA